MSLSSPFNANKWLETAIAENQIKFFDFKELVNIYKIGEGAFGKVHKAELKKDGRTVALKSLIIKNDHSKDLTPYLFF
ncbi:11103_t:CDS:2, partial [Ambispora leptoticha]